MCDCDPWPHIKLPHTQTNNMVTLRRSLRCHIYLRGTLLRSPASKPAMLPLLESSSALSWKHVTGLLHRTTNMQAQFRSGAHSRSGVSSVFTCNGPQTRSFPSERICKSCWQVYCWSGHGNIDSSPLLCTDRAWNIWKNKRKSKFT